MNKVHAIEEDIPEMEETPGKKRNAVSFFISKRMRIISTGRRRGKSRAVLRVSWCICLREKKKYVRAGEGWQHHFISGAFMQAPTRMQPSGNLLTDILKNHYDQDELKCVYISSDGGGWIRAAVSHVDKSRLVADRFHLMRYINRMARYTGEEKRC